MDIDRPPLRSKSNSYSSSTATITSANNTTSELFICFSSRLSSSSYMKFPLKSISSPSRARDSSQISLSTSLSRRLRNSGSLKGGQASPMFLATNGKKRGCSFENPEPTSPKVTCIGQVRVRVKTKRQGRKIRAARSRREVSFRGTEQGTNINSHHNLDANHYQECLRHRNQRWVHLPLTICEALRAFGAEFNCFLPSRFSCNNNNQREEDGKVRHHPNGKGNNANGSDSSCGAVFVRWLVGEEERNENDEEDDMPRRSQRRHAFEDIVIEGDNKCEQKNEILEDEGRVSICIPPKNALLLMRCRSDPVKMTALANRFWEYPPPQDEEAGDEEELEERKQLKLEQEQQVSCEMLVFPNQIIEVDKIMDAEAESKAINDVQEQGDKQPVLDEDEVASDSHTEAPADPDDEENAHKLLQENENVHADKQDLDEIENKRTSFSSSSEVLLQPEQQSQEDKQEQEAEVIVAEDSTERKEEGEEEREMTHERSEPGDTETGQESKEEDLLPDYLLLMMCEPKLSMEVSKETWVCSTDFIRHQPSEKKPPPQIVNKTDGCDEQQPKKKVSIRPTQQKQLLVQPPRSSCSFPAAPPLPPALGAPSVKTMNTMMKQNLVEAKPSSYEPFALTRCKSEPSKSSAKLAPVSCFWKNRKIEQHRPATLGIGTAGAG